MLLFSGLIGIACGIITIDCCQQNYCLGGIRNQYWLGIGNGNEDAGVLQFKLGDASRVSFLASFGALFVGLNSLKHYKNKSKKDRLKKSAIEEGKNEGDKLYVIKLNSKTGEDFI